MFDKRLVARCINGGQVALDAGNDQQQQVEQHRNEQAIYIVQCRDGDSVASDAINNVWQVAWTIDKAKAVIVELNCAGHTDCLVTISWLPKAEIHIIAGYNNDYIASNSYGQFAGLPAVV